jgi:hypothetical protein
MLRARAGNKTRMHRSMKGAKEKIESRRQRIRKQQMENTSRRRIKSGK